MVRAGTVAVLLIAVLAGAGHGAAPEPLIVGAKAAVLVDGGSGTVLMGQSEHARLPVASTTKILTALVALESSKPDEWVAVSERATKVEGSSLGLKPGERELMDTLLIALLLKSANDAAMAIAEHVGGSVEGFAARMNARAKQLGCTDSHFVNPNGLYDPNHYSSAYDLALMAREAMKQPRFRELVRSRQVDVYRPALNVTESMINHNKLLWRDDSVDGVKTGFVKESGHCLVASATREDWQLISVVLDSPDMYTETQAMLDWGFTRYGQQMLARPGQQVGEARVGYGQKRWVGAVCEFPLSTVVGPGVAEDAKVRAKMKEGLQAPIAAGQEVGTAELVVGGKVVATTPLVAKEAVAKSWALATAVWLGKIVVILVGAALLIRTNAKIIKAYRRRRRYLPAQSGRPGAGRTSMR